MSGSPNRTICVALLGLLLALANSGSAMSGSAVEEPTPDPIESAEAPDTDDPAGEAPDPDAKTPKPDLGRPPYNAWDRVDRLDCQPRLNLSSSSSPPVRINDAAGLSLQGARSPTLEPVVPLTPEARTGPSHRPHGPPR
jgi:hypothetical protein